MSGPATENPIHNSTRTAPSRPRTHPRTVILSVAVFVLAGANLAAAGYIYGALLEVRKLDARLAEHKKLENRLTRRIDRLSAVIKSEIEVLREVSLEKFEANSVNNSSEASVAKAPEIEPSEVNQQGADAGKEFGDESVQSGNLLTDRSDESDSTTKPSAPPKYQRVESSDGKVYFRKN